METTGGAAGEHAAALGAQLRATKPTIRVSNQTAKRIAIAEANSPGRAGLLLAPFATATVARSLTEQLDLHRWEARGLVVTEEPADTSAGQLTLRSVRGILYLATFFVMLAIAMPFLRALFPEFMALHALIVTLVFVMLLAIGSIFTWSRLGHQKRESLASWMSEKRWKLSQRFKSFMSAVIIIVATLLLLALVVFPDRVGQFLPIITTPPDPIVTTKTIQIMFVMIATFMPAMFYLWFTRQKVQIMRENFIQDVMNIDPDVHTIGEVKSKYCSQFDEIYGSGEYQSRQISSSLPVWICTLLIASGWFLTLPIFDSSVTNPSGSSNFNPILLFSPTREVFIFGFLGAYFFGLNFTFKRYVRSDLAPKAYSHIILRILAAVIMVWVVSVLVGQDGRDTQSGALIALPLAFIIGIMPETGMTLIFDSVKRLRVLKWAAPALEEEHPLTLLEGMNLYDQARLSEEGIENVENLAHHNIISLMLRTRIATPRLIDLVDQAVLYLHVRGDAVSWGGKDSKRSEPRERLRDYGIRTATDLEAAARAARRRGRDEYQEFLRLLDPQGAGSERAGTPGDPEGAGAERADKLQLARLRLVLDALQDDEWMPHLRHWRETRSGCQHRVWRFEDFYSTQRSCTGDVRQLQPRGAARVVPEPDRTDEGLNERPHWKESEAEQQATHPGNSSGGDILP